jgi:radical SAM superfamily enzyme YgiQ (UPF0313 family)
MSLCLLLNLNWRTSRDFGVMTPDAVGLPLELAYIASALEARGLRHGLSDLFVEDAPLDAIADLIGRATEIVVCSAPAYVFWRDGIKSVNFISKSLADLKQMNPSARLILIGPHGTARPDTFFDSKADFIVRGEPDETIPCLIERLHADEDAGNLPGVCSRTETGWAVSEAIEVADLNNLPPVSYERFPLSRYRWPPHPASIAGGIVAPLEASRGCPYQCVYCFKVGFRDTLRMKTPDKIYEEAVSLRSLGVNYVYLIDEVFGLNRSWGLEVARALGKAGLSWGCQTRANLLDKAIVRTWAGSGCRHVQIGLESTNNEILKRARKGGRLDINAFRETVCMMVNHEIQVDLFLIVGMPGDSPQNLREVAAVLETFPLDRVNLIPHKMLAFPGTRSWEMGIADGKDLSGWNDIDRYAGLIQNQFHDEEHLDREFVKFYGRLGAARSKQRLIKTFRASGKVSGRDAAKILQYAVAAHFPRVYRKIRKSVRGA